MKNIMEEELFVKKTYLINLYKRLELYISTNYPKVIITKNQKSVSLSYPGEWARIFIYQNKEQNALIVRITQDLDNKMSLDNGTQYYLSSTEELTGVKGAIRAILSMKPHPVSMETEEETEIESIEHPSNTEGANNSSKVCRKFFKK